MWQHEEDVLAANGLTHGEWAVLITAAYYIPLPVRHFIPHAAWESAHDTTEAQARRGYESCLSRGLIRLTEAGHVERERHVFGQYTGESTEYPADGVVLTEAGYALHSKVCLELFGPEYFATRNWW